MRIVRLGIAVLAAAASCGCLPAQAPVDAMPATAASVPAEVATVPLHWTPPALAQLSTQAMANSSFTLDRSMLQAMAGLMGNAEDGTKAAIAKLDGVSVHVLRFADGAPADPVLVDEVRDAYHLPGWKHVVSASESGGPVHDAKTDVWVVMDGVNLRGAVVLVAGAKGLTLATVAGNLSPVDLLHLRGHFGIPRFDGGALTGDAGR